MYILVQMIVLGLASSDVEYGHKLFAQRSLTDQFCKWTSVRKWISPVNPTRLPSQPKWCLRVSTAVDWNHHKESIQFRFRRHQNTGTLDSVKRLPTRRNLLASIHSAWYTLSDTLWVCWVYWAYCCKFEHLRQRKMSSKKFEELMIHNLWIQCSGFTTATRRFQGLC